MKFSEPIRFCFPSDIDTEECFDYNETYFSFPAVYESQKNEINFAIINNNTSPIEIDFIDYSQEINISFEQFLNWNYEVKFLYSDYYIPGPITFNVEQVQEESTYSFNTKTKGKIVNDDNLLYYCIINKNGCNFEVLNTLTVTKGQKYKFKLNPSVIIENEIPNYFFESIQLKNTELDVSEIQFGYTKYEIKKNEKKYFLVKTKSYRYLYGFIQNNNYQFNFAFISEKQKENLNEEIDNIDFDSETTDYHASFDSYDSDYNDYLLIELTNEEEEEDYIGSIFIVKNFYYSEEISVIENKKNEQALIVKYNSDYENILLSSDNNLYLISDLFYEQKPTNKLIIKNSHHSQYIYIDSLDHSSTINIYTYTKPYDEYNFNLVIEDDLNNIFTQ